MMQGGAISLISSSQYLDLNTDELIAKRANLQRVKEFARNLKQYNDSTLIQQPKLPAAAEQVEINKSMQKLVSKRTKAIEFAKQIPKPKAKTSVASEVDNSGIDVNEKDVYGTTNDDAQRLAELEMKHEEKRRQIEAIKRSMGMKA
jgi:hypothetical protein